MDRLDITHPIGIQAAARHDGSRAASRLIAFLFDLFGTWRHRSISRRELAKASPEVLLDIGISREQAARESIKRFWAP